MKDLSAVTLLVFALLAPRCASDAPSPPLDTAYKVDAGVEVDAAIDLGSSMDAADPADAPRQEDLGVSFSDAIQDVLAPELPHVDAAEDTGDEPDLASLPIDAKGDVTEAVDVADSDDLSSGDVGKPDPAGTWRSMLFPADWTPEFEGPGGLFLHDFSYAGYHRSEVALPLSTDLPTFSVADYGATPSQSMDSTSGFQAAIDAAQSEGGGVVWVPEGLYRLDGKLSVTGSQIVIRGAGSSKSKLYFTLATNMSDQSHIKFSGTLTTDGDQPLVSDGLSRSHLLEVEDATEFQTGDDVTIGWTITEAFIDAHNMTGTWQAFNGTWVPFFRRTVMAVDTSASPHVMTLDVPLRYKAKVSDGASVRKESGALSEVGFEAIGLSNSVSFDDAWANVRVHVLEMRGVKDAWVRDVVSFVSPAAPATGNGKDAHLQNGGIIVRASKRVTVADSSMGEAQNRGGSGCGYLFEVRTSSEILFRDCTAKEGRHNFIQNWGFGLTGTVWLRCHSEDGFAVILDSFPAIGKVGYSEFHHSLATANLIDSNTIHDGWKAVNRLDWSTGAGHTATETVFWNNHGDGKIVSRQFGHGFIIGTSGGLDAVYTLTASEATGTSPQDFIEGVDEGDTLWPTSLFEAQLERRLGLQSSP